MIRTVVVADSKLKPFTHASEGSKSLPQPEAAVSGFFVVSRSPDAMRYVGGGEIRNPVTRASQSGDGGLRIEPGGNG